MSIIKDPDQRRMEQWQRTAKSQSGFSYGKFLGFGDLGAPSLSSAEEYSLHTRYFAKANSLNLSDIAEMKIVYVFTIKLIVFLEFVTFLVCFKS